MGNGMRKLSAEYERRATALTEGIEQVEAQLQELPGKVFTSTAIGDGQRLAWCRHEKQWRILLMVHDCEAPLTSASVESKAYAAKYLGCLIDDIEENLKKQSEIAAIGLGALHLLFNPAEAPQ